MLAGNKNGRKIGGYVFGIALFILLVPIIAVYGLFGWMAGGAENLFTPEDIYAQVPQEYLERIEQNSYALERIAIVFEQKDISEKDRANAKMIYLSCLVGKESEEKFYERYAECFINASTSEEIFLNISSAFDIEFPEEDNEEIQGGKLE